MFSTKTSGTELVGQNGGTVTVSLVAGRTETLMGLQGNFATSDATGHLHLANVTASSAVSSMVIGGGFDGGAFLLNGPGTELSSGAVILTATYTVDGGTSEGSYSIPVTIEAAAADGEMAEDSNLMAKVNVTVKAEEVKEEVKEGVPPVPETAEPEAPKPETPAPAPTNNLNEGTDGQTAEEREEKAEEKKEDAVEEKAEEKTEESVEADGTVATKTTGTSRKKETTTATTLAQESVTEDATNATGVVIGVVAVVLVVGAAVTLIVLQKMGKIHLSFRKKVGF